MRLSRKRNVPNDGLKVGDVVTLYHITTKDGVALVEGNRFRVAPVNFIGVEGWTEGWKLPREYVHTGSVYRQWSRSPEEAVMRRLRTAEYQATQYAKYAKGWEEERVRLDELRESLGIPKEEEQAEGEQDG